MSAALKVMKFCCFICVTQRWALYVVIKRQFLHFICIFSTSVHSHDTNIPVLKTNGRYVGIVLPVSITSACDLALAYNFLSELDDK